MQVDDVALDVDDEMTDGGARCRVVQVEQPPHERAFGRVWAELVGLTVRDTPGAAPSARL